MVKKEISDLVLDLVVIYCLKNSWNNIPSGDLVSLNNYVNIIRKSKEYKPIVKFKIDEARTGRFFGESYTSDDLNRLESNLLYLDLNIKN